MPEVVVPGPVTEERRIREAVCVHTKKIFDSCRDKDCVEDLRVYLTRESQAALDRSTGAKTRCAELLFARVEVEPLAYKRGHYAVDLTFYYRILGDATVGGTRPVTITGLAVFTKRVALYGGRGKAKTFSSTDALPTPDGLLQDRLPVGVVEALDPMILASKVREVCDCCRCETELTEIPPAIAEALGEELVLTGGTRRLYVTVGQFSTVRLERGAQLAVQSGGYCMPTRECCDDEGCEEDPCELFSRVDFPVRAFYPEGSDCGGTSCCGSCGKSAASCLRLLPDLTTSLHRVSAVRVPSPVVANSRLMTWPDCSPPSV